MKNILVLSLIMLATLTASAAYRRKIPAPIINSSTAMLAPGETLTIKGRGFINNYPQGHIVYLRNQRGGITKATPIYSNATELQVRINDDLSFGDYELGVKLRSKWLESSVSLSPETTKLRPLAPKIQNNNNYVYKNLSELASVLATKDSQGHELVYKLVSELKAGSNLLNAHYYANGYLSLPSETISVMLLPEAAINPELEITGSQIMVRRKASPSSLELELPAIIFSASEEPSITASTRLSELNLSSAPSLIDVSPYSHSSNGDYSQEIYLDSPTSPHYLSKKAFSSPIKILQIHVKSPESLLLYNQSSKTFPLASCGLSDNIMTRHNFFEPSSITAGDPFLYTGDLGLNDTGGDSMSLDCPCTHPIVMEAIAQSKQQGFAMPACVNNKLRLESFSYESLDSNGYGLR